MDSRLFARVEKIVSSCLRNIFVLRRTEAVDLREVTMHAEDGMELTDFETVNFETVNPIHGAGDKPLDGKPFGGGVRGDDGGSGDRETTGEASIDDVDQPQHVRGAGEPGPRRRR